MRKDVRPLSSSDQDEQPDARMDEFVRLLGQNQRRLYVYVMSMVPNLTDAEEILQETNLLLWRDFDRFQRGTNFAAWACKVALNQTLTWRKRKRRDKLQFTSEFIEAVAAETSAEAERLEERAIRLAHCIEMLPEKHRRLLSSRYRDQREIEAISREEGRTPGAVYRSLSRIRASLHECVSRSLTKDSNQ